MVLELPDCDTTLFSSEEKEKEEIALMKVYAGIYIDKYLLYILIFV